MFSPKDENPRWPAMTTVNTNVLMKYIVVPNRKVICLSHQKLLDPGIGSLKFLLAEEF